MHQQWRHVYLLPGTGIRCCLFSLNFCTGPRGWCRGRCRSPLELTHIVRGLQAHGFSSSCPVSSFRFPNPRSGCALICSCPPAPGASVRTQPALLQFAYSIKGWRKWKTNVGSHETQSPGGFQLSLPGSNLTLQAPTVHSSSLPCSSPAVLRPTADLGTTPWHRLFNWFPFTCEVCGKTMINTPPLLSTQLYRKAELWALVVCANTSCYYHRPSFDLQIGIHQCLCAASQFSKHILSAYCVLSVRSVLPLVILLFYKDKEKGKSWDKDF